MKALHGKMVGEKMMQLSPDLICLVDRNGYLLFVSDASERIIGYKSKELINSKFVDFILPGDCHKTLKAGQDTLEGSKTTYVENCCIHKSGTEVPIMWSLIWSNENDAFFCIGRDITEQKLAMQRLREKDEMFQSLIEHSSDILTCFDEELNYVYCGGSVLRELGYEPEQLIGANAMNFIYPDDVPMIKDSLLKVFATKGKVEISEFRFKDANGDWKWIKSRASNQLQNPSIKAIVVSSRDVTEKVNNRIKLQESEKRFKSLFDHHQDIILFQNKNRVIVDVNAATLSFFGVQKQNIINRPFSDFLSPEVTTVCEKIFQEALNGKLVRHEIVVPFENKGSCTFEVVKVPVIVNGETIGIYSILRDITEISHSNNTIKEQATKLNAILESITDAFFTLDNNWNFTYFNSEFDKLFGLGRTALLGEKIWQFSPPGIRKKLYQQFHKAKETGETAHFEVYYEEIDKWLYIKAFPSEDSLSIFIDDITERIKSRQELEKLSLVASKTTNGVVIMNALGVAEWVNEGFEKLTGYTSTEVEGRRPDYLLQGRVIDKASIQLVREKRRQGKPFSEEMLVYKKSGEKVWLLIDVTPVLNDMGKITRFIAIQTDITERKEAEENQLLMTKDLFRQNRDLQQFTYIVSHNLRAPVASIMGLADLLTTTLDKGSETYNISLGYLKGTADQLDTVLRDLNLILSIRDKKDASGKERVELTPVCQQVITALQEPLNQCEGKVLISIEEGTYVNGNKAYVYSIFYNLLTNSIKYRLPDRPLEVNIKCFGSSDTGTIISFSDNGSGFDMKKEKDNIFKLYKRFHPASDGRGIGLFLVKTHVEAMDGQIEVNSQINGGTTFLINLK